MSFLYVVFCVSFIGFLAVLSWKITSWVFRSFYHGIKSIKRVKKKTKIEQINEPVSQPSLEILDQIPISAPTQSNNRIIRTKKNGWRLPDSDKMFLRNWLSSHMNKRLDKNTLEMLAPQTSITLFQIHDFLRDEKRR